MMTLTLGEMVALHRELKAQIAPLQSGLDDVREEIRLAVIEDGPYKDDDGYARLTKPSKPSVTYKSATVHQLASAWQVSEDAVMQSCGVMLKQLATEKPGGTQNLQVK